MAETSKMKDVKSPEEIEEEIKSTPTVDWDPFSVLPKEIYVKIFDKLESPTDKHNFMNAHVQFYELFESQRVLFLFDQVFNEVIRNAEEEDLYLDPGTFQDYNQIFNPYQNCGLVCRDWDVGFQNFFQWHGSFFALDHDEIIWSPNFNLKTIMCGFVWEPCNSLALFPKAEVDKQLEKFSVTHPPSRNPFFSRNITLLPFCDRPEGEIPEEVQRFRTSVDALLTKYGQHIWHCKIEIEEKLNPEACVCIGKWISLMPELKTLQLTYEEEVEPLSMMDLKQIEETQLIQTEMKKLVVLKSSYIPAILFNKLVGNLPQLERIQLKIFKGEESFLRDFELMIEREKLEEAFLTLKGYADFEYLQGSQPFPNLKKLSTTLEFGSDEERNKKAYSKWPEWKLIFEILKEKFPALEELNLRLLKAMSEEDKGAAIDQSVECQLNLPKLKKLWIALPNLCSLDFLHPCKALEVLTVVLEHSDWDLQSSREVGRQGHHKINFNMDLMWESNIWEVFPKLYKLNFWAWCETRSGFYHDTYEKNGERRESVDFSSRVAKAYE